MYARNATKLAEVREQMKQLKKMEAEMVELAKAGELPDTNSHYIVRSEITTRRLDTNRLKKELPDVAAKYTSASISVRINVHDATEGEE